MVAEDRNTVNGGRWIYEPMTYTESSDKKQVAAASLAYRMKMDFLVAAFAGDHYCKLVSPFKAMEWIYVDSLYASLSQETTIESSSTPDFI